MPSIYSPASEMTGLTQQPSHLHACDAPAASARGGSTVSSVGVHRHVVYSLLCMLALMCCWSCLYFAAMCVLLHFTNTNAVHDTCPGLWDYVLYAFVFPMISPALYVCLQWSSGFSSLAIGCAFGLALIGAVISLKASTSFLCVETLRAATPPVPWLLFVAWLKTLFFLSTFVAALKPQH